MRAKHPSIRLDPATGDIWLFDDQARRRVKNITSDVLLTLCADLFADERTAHVSREVKFADGTAARVTVERVDAE